jgi:copper chaperone CopZ
MSNENKISMVLKVKGMHCAACSNGITFLLQSLDGIGKVNIEWDKGGGEVEYDPEKITPEKIKSAIDELGEYSVEKIEAVA